MNLQQVRRMIQPYRNTQGNWYFLVAVWLLELDYLSDRVISSIAVTVNLIK